jgi:uncharacterized protein YbaR (Trm112 family)
MKPWLCDILACPIDKFFPLDLYIFSFETNEGEFEEIIKVYEKRDINQIKDEKIIDIQEESGVLYLKDDLVIERSSVEVYLNLIISSVKEVDKLHDKSSNQLSKQCFRIIRQDVKDKLVNFVDNGEFEKIENILPELYLINKIKTEIEINTGLLFCEECKRWYPIIETIPQMLPDFLNKI